MKNSLVIALMIISINVSAQSGHIGINGGLGWTNVLESRFPHNDMQQRPSYGLTYEYTLQNSISFTAGITYDQRGFRSASIVRDEDGALLSDEVGTFKFDYNYLSLPLKAGYHFGKKFYGFGNIGIVPGLLINAKHHIPGYQTGGTTVEPKTIDVTDRVNEFDIAGLVEIGAGYNIKAKYKVFTSVTYQHSFTTFANSNYFSNAEITHHALTLSVGMKYRLSKA
jgi:hypothetical protein